jgi:hypothetical protein
MLYNNYKRDKALAKPAPLVSALEVSTQVIGSEIFLRYFKI